MTSSFAFDGPSDDGRDRADVDSSAADATDATDAVVYGSPVDAVDDAVDFLTQAKIDVVGRMPWSSNATFLVTVTHDGATHHAIYKPVRGERPLWDFEPGLDRRERAAFVLSEWLDFHVVPPTVIRDDAPFGQGSLQWFVNADHNEHYFTLYEQRPDLHPQLQAIAAFDVVANNTDRKAGHCLLAGDRVWAIDNGLCFGDDFKLRTVIWEFGGDPIPDRLLEPIAALIDDVPPGVGELLNADEVEAISGRAASLVMQREFPTDPSGRRYPWPLV